METRDFIKHNQDLDEAGLYQLAAEEAARPGKRTKKSTTILTALVESLELFDAQVREIEALAEEKRKAGLLGPNRKFSRRQLYARAIRYTHWNGDPSPANAELMRKLREALHFTLDDHEQLLEKLIDKGWAPPKKITRSPPGSTDPQVEKIQLNQRPSPPATMSASASVDLEPPTQEVQPPERPAKPPLSPPEEGDSLDNIQINPLETTPHLPLRRQDLTLAPSLSEQEKPDSRKKQMALGMILGILLVALPVAFWMSLQKPAPEDIPDEEWPTAPTQTTAPTPSQKPPPPPTQKPALPTKVAPPTRVPPPPKPKSLLELFQEQLPQAKESPPGGLELLTWLRTRMVRNAPTCIQALKAHPKLFRKKINKSFARRNEQIFEASQWDGKAGGFSPDFYNQAMASLQGIEKADEIPKEMAHAYFLVLLAFYMDTARYPIHLADFKKLVPELKATLQSLPSLAGSGAGMVLRVIGEDLRDCDSPELSTLGLELLKSLAKAKASL
jgi:hypothetical protein